MGQQIAAAKLAKLLGLTRKELTGLEQEGLAARNGKQYDLEETVTRYVGHLRAKANAEARDPGEVKGVAALAGILGVTERTVLRYMEKEGMPVLVHGGKGNPHIFRLSDVIDWRLERATGNSAEKEKARLTKEQADREAMANEVRRGELLPTQHVLRALQNVFNALKSNLRGLPTALAAELAATKSSHECNDLLREAIDQCLEELSTLELGGVAVPAEECAAGAEAPAKTDRKRVGRQRKKAKSRGKRKARKVANK